MGKNSFMQIIHSYQFLNNNSKFKLSKNKNTILNDKNEKILGLLNIPNDNNLFFTEIKKLKKKKNYNVIINVNVKENILKDLIKKKKIFNEKKKFLILVKKNNTINNSIRFNEKVKSIDFLLLETILNRKLQFYKHNLINFYNIIIDFNKSKLFLKNSINKNEYINYLSYTVIINSNLLNIFNLQVLNKMNPILIITEKEYFKQISNFLIDKKFIIIKNKKDRNQLINYDYIIIENKNNIPLDFNFETIIYIFIKKFNNNLNHNSNRKIFITDKLEYVNLFYNFFFKDKLVYNYKKFLDKCIFKIHNSNCSKLFTINKNIHKYLEPTEILLYNIIEESIFNYKVIGETEFKNDFKNINNLYKNFNECCICLKKIQKDKLSFLECEHYFCVDCININSKLYKKCPICRTEYKIYNKLNYSNKIKFLINLNFKNIIIIAENNIILKCLNNILENSTIVKSKIKMKQYNFKYVITNIKNLKFINKNKFQKIIFIENINYIDKDIDNKNICLENKYTN